MNFSANLSNTEYSQNLLSLWINLQCYIFIIIVGSLGNSFILLSLLLTPKLRTTSNVIVGNLAVIDLTICSVICAPYFYFEIAGLSPSPSYCSFLGFILFFCVSQSVYSMTLIALSRYFVMINDSSQGKILFSHKNRIIMFITSWSLSLFFASCPFFGVAKYTYAPYSKICFLKDDVIDFIYLSIYLALNQFPCMVVIGVCYFKIFKKLKQAEKDMESTQMSLAQKRKQENIRVTKILFAIYIIFLVFWAPGSLALPTRIFIHFNPMVYQFTHTLAFSHSALNPMLYGLNNKSFKKAILRIMHCRCLKVVNEENY